MITCNLKLVFFYILEVRLLYGGLKQLKSLTLLLCNMLSLHKSKVLSYKQTISKFTTIDLSLTTLCNTLGQEFPPFVSFQWGPNIKGNRLSCLSILVILFFIKHPLSISVVYNIHLWIQNWHRPTDGHTLICVAMHGAVATDILIDSNTADDLW